MMIYYFFFLKKIDIVLSISITDASFQNEINSNLHAIKFITICPGITETPLAVTSALYIRPEFLEMAAQAKDKHLMQT